MFKKYENKLKQKHVPVITVFAKALLGVTISSNETGSLLLSKRFALFKERSSSSLASRHLLYPILILLCSNQRFELENKFTTEIKAFHAQMTLYSEGNVCTNAQSIYVEMERKIYHNC